MNRHLTQDELIKYQFQLDAEQRRASAAEHLAQCERCASQLAQLQRKFSLLDVMSDDWQASDELIGETLAQINEAPPAAPGSPRWLAWFAAAVAASVIGVGLLLGFLRNGPLTSPPDVAHLTTPTTTTTVAAVDSPFEKPPFAPASNIELVTLPRRDDVQITIYNGADLTLVRERRKLTMKRGWNWLQFMWANTLIDPTSLSLEPQQHGDEIEIQQLVFPPRLPQVGRWLIRSEVSGQVPFEITYFTSGLSWQAFYMGTMSADETTMDLKGYVKVNNQSGEDYEDAQTRLIVGKLHLVDPVAELAKRDVPYGQPGADVSGPVSGGEWGFQSPIVARFNGQQATRLWGRKFYATKEIIKQGLSEYFLYTIEGTETIPHGWGKRLPSIDVTNIPVESLYKHDEERFGQLPVRFVAFANDERHQLGETPLPDGRVMIYGNSGHEGYLAYTGTAAVKYIPVDEKVELNLGPARQILVQPTLVEFQNQQHVYDAAGNISGWDEVRTWRLAVKNTREFPVRVELTRQFATSHWSLECADDVGYEKHDLTHARFTLTVPPRSENNIDYVVQTYHGKREQAMP